MSRETYSSYPEHQLLSEAWYDFLKRGARGGYGRKGGSPAPSAAPAPGGESPTEPSAEPTAATPAAPSPTASDDGGMPISGTEFATMNFLTKGKLLDIIRRAAMTGAAAKDPASKNLLQLFNKEFFPALVRMTKNPNIDIAEGIDMDEFLLEMLNEAADAMTKRQQAAMKGKLRSRGGMQNYLKSAGGKPPIIANNIKRALEKALSQNISAESLLSAAAEVSSTIKNDKERAQYEKRYEDLLYKAPEKRIANYKQNVAAFIDAVSALATKAAAIALASGGDFAGDKAARTAASRAPAPAPAPQKRNFVGQPRRVFTEDEAVKTFRITSEGKVVRIGNEKK